jgi:hypothetical protein
MDTYGLRIVRLIIDSPVRKIYTVGDYDNSEFCKEINKIDKYGEMAMIAWYQVISTDGTIREVNGKYVVEIEYENTHMK